MDFFAKIERAIAFALLALMAVVVASGVLEVGYVVFTDLFKPPGLFLGVADLFDVFGLFLMVLIGLELMASIQMYLNEHKVHAEMMFLVAITAVARKIVILDSKSIEPMLVFSIGFLVLALSAGYYFVKTNRKGQSE
jgi:uncharacterized membrane protein (DUF373 family)